MEEKLYDITAVCRLLGTTSRALRFYEEKGLITSTVSAYSSRRRYTEAQIETIRHVLVLRSIGLPIRAIAELQKQGDLREAVLVRRAEIFAAFVEKVKEINLLEEVIATLESGGTILDPSPRSTVASNKAERIRITEKCSRDFVEGDGEVLYTYLSDKMKQYMPREAYRQIRADALAPVGTFLRYGDVQIDPKLPNVILHDLIFERLTVSVKYVFHASRIYGYWVNYKERR